MEIVIAILFSTVISMGVSLYFRMLGKKDDPLERINKFAIKKTSELNEAFNKIQTRFNTIISEFNAQQTQANAAVKLLKQQNDEFNSKMQTFDQSINAVKNIKAQIDAYSKILTELNDMTAQVEENLERLAPAEPEWPKVQFPIEIDPVFKKWELTKPITQEDLDADERLAYILSK